MSRGSKPINKGKGLRAKRDPKLTAWGKAVLERDGWQCQAFRFQGCYEFSAMQCSNILDPHHISERSLRPDLRYDLNNGITLCRRHHDWLPLHRTQAVKLGLLGDETYEKAMRG